MYPNELSIWASGYLGHLSEYTGMPVIESPYLAATETELYQETVDRTFKERWIDPIFKDPISLPFEPWVKTKEVTKSRTVPSRKVLISGGVMYIHPSMRSELNRIIQENQN